MAILRPPGLGPIVGHTTDRSSRIWIRADPATDGGDHPGSERRTVGVLGVFAKDGRKLDPPRIFYFRLHREFDRSGSVDLGAGKSNFALQPDSFPLEPDSEYVVRAGCLVLDDPVADDAELDDPALEARLPEPSAWQADLEALDPAQAEAAFRTFPAEPGDEARQPGDLRGERVSFLRWDAGRAGQGHGAGVLPGERVSFLLGSCRYPGLLWKVRHSDRIFGPMADLAQAAEDRPRFVLMVGDQIYADRFNRLVPFGRADSYQEFRDRYLAAFGSPNIRRLMRTLPTYMILDDHEIEDNWSQDRLRRSARYPLFTIAIDAYLSYQWSHGPRTWGRRLYYRFDCGGFPFFVLDTRTQRFLEGKPGDLAANHMLGRPSHPTAPPGQLARLLSWLRDQQRTRGATPKFVVSSGVFVPSPMSARTALAEDDPEALEKSDGWPGFPGTRSAILRTIVEHEIQNVVFLSGDIHCANLAEISFAGVAEDDAAAGVPEARRIKAFSVTSSAFYWPFPFADGEPSDFVHDSTAQGQEDTFEFELSDGRKVAMDYRARNFSQEDNFSHLTVDRASHSLRVRVLDNKGRVVSEEAGRGRRVTLDERLSLAPW